jgi:hypothetical protein
MLSVDVSDWVARVEDPGSAVNRTAARDCAKEQIATEVYRQIAKSLRAITPTGLGVPRQEAQMVIPDYFAYHIDSGIVFDPRTNRPIRNETPYFIPLKGEFHKRPGALPWNPTPGVPSSFQPGVAVPELFQAPHGGYCVHWNSLVFAGTYLKTFTRLTSMEAANESARHAVNAIIDHLLHYKNTAQVPIVDFARPPRTSARKLVQRLEALDQSQSAQVHHPTAAGDYCKIWDIEDNEQPEFTWFKAADQLFFDAGLDHPMKALGYDALFRVFASAGSLLVSSAGGFKLFFSEDLIKTVLEKLRALLSTAGQPMSNAAAPGSIGEAVINLGNSLLPFKQAEAVLELLKRIREELERNA